MTRLFGLDIGDRRTGIAISDELGLTARALKTVETAELPAVLKELQSEYEAGVIIVGRPRSLDGSLGQQAERVDAVVSALKSSVPAKYIYEDETGTTVDSADGTDAEAARVILQGYLNEHS